MNAVKYYVIIILCNYKRVREVLLLLLSARACQASEEMKRFLPKSLINNKMISTVIIDLINWNILCVYGELFHQ